jgi:quinone-modifying oxidoreductase subunit QmoC
MSENVKVVNPDLQFIKDLQAVGGDSLKKCFQCATCSVACKLTPDDSPFPRKEMIQAQWGQKEVLLSDPDVWLCHQCNDCSVSCPRGARPGDVLAAIRNMTFRNYAVPSIFGKMLSKPAYLPILLIVPLLILMGVVQMFGDWNPTGEIVFDKFYPELAIDGTFLLLAAFSITSLMIGLNRFWKAMVKHHGETGLAGAPIPNIVAALPIILSHEKFNTCGENKDRYIGHLAVFYGFVAAFITTGFVMVQYWVLGMHTPYPQFSHVKLIGNFAGLAIITGGVLLFARRIANKKSVSNYYDWSLIALVTGLGVTGLLTEIIRLTGSEIAYPSYLIHLMFVFYLIAYLPFSKMAHIAYRTTAMAFARAAQRDFVQKDGARIM